MRRTKEDSEQTWSAILDAAERLFSEKGIAATTLETISRAAGVTRGAFYWHFKDKSDLMAAMRSRRTLPQQELLLLAAERGHEDPLGLLEIAGHEVLATFEVDEGQQRLFRIFSNHGEDSEVAGWIAQHDRDVFDLVRGVAERAQQVGMLNPAFAPDEAAVLMLVTINGLLSEWLRSRSFPLSTLGRKILSVQMSLLKRPQ
ncbi:TetR family transcriptional regulator [Mesorhizobium sp. LHD-90]|uniref:TetR family transcriptional regulator n=1 Tax=Mesorhizobium sp. LHD-90 TaxID=3071414 RepID=UPI0027E0897A|nr:TetR family transcriptional regulator [Mesorhizobium sp. LHD-90]MDQ6438088.1 TetR family transcriptional regulator [Mesorhizobium sp. LHD-90]